MNYFIRQRLTELQAATQAVRDEPFGINLFDFFHQPFSQMGGWLVKFLLEPHNACHTATTQRTVDRLQIDAGR